MVDILKLKQHLINAPDLIEKVLIECGFSNIHHVPEGWRAGWEEKSGGNSIIINAHNLWCTSFSKNIQGDLITLVQKRLGMIFPKAVKMITTTIGYEESTEEIVESKIEVFGGLFNQFKAKKQQSEIITTYDESVLDRYLKMPNKRFLKDGIGIFTQDYYEIMYDPLSNRIVIVWRNVLGEITGIMGRLNKAEIEEYESKYLPLIPFKKKKILYGLNQNYGSIADRGTIVIGESEKLVMQMHSYGFHNAVSIGGSYISDQHKNLIHSAMPKKIILALDEGTEEDRIVAEAEKLKAVNPFMDKAEIYYIYDKLNDILPKGSKSSPTDFGKDGLKELMMNNMRRI